MPVPAGPAPLDLTGLHRTAWRLWIDGYQAGLRHGLAAGYTDAGHDWTAVTVAACHAAPRDGLSHAELQRRRSHYPIPARTAEQIRDHAARSWAEVDSAPRSHRNAA